MTFKKDSVAYVVIFTFAVCVLFVLILAAANQVTLSAVQANKSFAAHLAVLKAFGLADDSTPRADVESMYAAKIKELPAPASEHSSAAFSTDIDASPYIAVRVTGAGLWGSISAIIAADPAATRIKGVEILDQQETPGLGGRISEPWFSAQFRDKKTGPDKKIIIDQNGSGKGESDKENSRVDAITGASRTSDFVARIVNDGLAAIAKIGGAL